MGACVPVGGCVIQPVPRVAPRKRQILEEESRACLYLRMLSCVSAASVSASVNAREPWFECLINGRIFTGNSRKKTKAWLFLQDLQFFPTGLGGNVSGWF